MQKLKISKGVWRNNSKNQIECVTNFANKVTIQWTPFVPKNIIDTSADTGKLFIEAGTVYNEVGKSPRQLADENKELLEALKDLCDVQGCSIERVLPKYDKAMLLIKKHTAQPCQIDHDSMARYGETKCTNCKQDI